MAFKSRLKCLFLKPIFCILFATFLHFARNTTFDENQQAAIDAALANAGLGQEDVTDIGCTLDEATQQYTVTFTFQDIKNTCMVDAATFTVLSSIQG